MTTLKIAPCFAQTAVTPIPGARVDTRSYEATAADLALTTQIIAMGLIPAGQRVVDFALEADDLDDATALTITVGVLNVVGQGTKYVESAALAVPDSPEVVMGTTPTLVSGKNLITANTIGQTGGRAYSALAFTEAIGVNHDYDRVVGVQFPAGAGTAAAGTIRLILTLDAG